MHMKTWGHGNAEWEDYKMNMFSFSKKNYTCMLIEPWHVVSQFISCESWFALCKSTFKILRTVQSRVSIVSLKEERGSLKQKTKRKKKKKLGGRALVYCGCHVITNGVCTLWFISTMAPGFVMVSDTAYLSFFAYFVHYQFY